MEGRIASAMEVPGLDEMDVRTEEDKKERALGRLASALHPGRALTAVLQLNQGHASSTGKYIVHFASSSFFSIQRFCLCTLEDSSYPPGKPSGCSSLVVVLHQGPCYLD